VDGTGTDDGEDAGIPDFQGRIGFCGNLITDEIPASFGIGGYWGQREADIPGDKQTYTSYAIVGDLVLPISKAFQIYAEAFYGQAMQSYNAGLKNDFNVVTGEEIPGWGAFVNLHIKPDMKWFIVVGAGIDDPDDKKIPDMIPDGSGGMKSNKARVKNTSIFVNVRYKLTKQLIFGLEYDHMETKYINTNDGTNDRFQFTAMLKF
jgi:hypothetical protein